MMRRAFETTKWSVVLRARGAEASGSPEALAALCQAYWFPLYAFARRQGHSADDAADLVQAYFAAFLEKNFLHGVRPEAGRFRSFLLVSMRHFLANAWDRTQTKKRGGDFDLVPLETGEAEARYVREPSHELTPERVYERRWALTVLDRVHAALRREFAAAGKAPVLAELEVFLTGQEPQPSYRVIGERLEMSEGAVKVAVHRLRRRFGDRLREEIADTVVEPAEIDDEIRHLLSAIA